MGKERDIIYDLIDHLGGYENSTIVLKELIQFLNTDQITEFVEYFTTNHSITIPGYETYELCMDCQDTYESNEDHRCIDDDDTDSMEIASYFSSLIPPC